MQAGEALQPSWPAGRPGQPVPAPGCHGDDAGEAARVSELDRQEILGDAPFSGSGLRVEVAHQGNTNAWIEEAGEAPCGPEFLYDPHRLNVATSRVRVMAVIVASPDLIRVSYRTRIR